MAARPPYGKEMINFINKSKLLMLTNWLPNVDVSDEAFVLDRLKLLPMLARFEKNPANNTFVNTTLKTPANQDALFARLVQGAFEFYRDGTVGDIPAVCADAMKKYLAEMDTVSRFIADQCEKGDSFHVSPSDFNEHYTDFCTEQDERSLRPREVKKRMIQLGFKEPFRATAKDAKRNKKMKNKKRYWRGIRINADSFTSI
jgi:phage/plasmid-associated DNA primase